MADYNHFAQFYDAVMGDRTLEVSMIKNMVAKEHPKAKKVLELACGTGALLKPLSKQYEVSGLDISEGMLTVAQKVLPRAHLYHQSMTDFQMNEQFDVILCLFDSINHLLNFKDWQRMFASVAKHLNPGGVFIFDINTQFKLTAMSAQRPFTKKFGKNYLIMGVSPTKKNVAQWNVQVFEHLEKDLYHLHEETIRETSFPTEDIKKSLHKHFKKVHVLDTKRKRPSKNSARPYFIARNA